MIRADAALFSAEELMWFARNICAQRRGDETDPVFDAMVKFGSERGLELFEEGGD
jgi:hypothetical protein